jgi:hypothetical protein
MHATALRVSTLLACFVASTAASSLAFERPDRPYPPAVAYTDGASGFVDREDTANGDTHLSAGVVCTYGEPGDSIWAFGELIGPDAQIWTAKSIKQKQGANLKMTVVHSTNTLLWRVSDVVVPFCRASVSVVDKDANLTFYDVKDAMTFKMECDGDLPTAMGLTEEQRAVFLARTGGVTAISCKGKVVGDIQAGCFRGDTVVATEQGPRAIRDIAIGERVWSWDETAQKKVLSKVTKTFVHPARGLRLVRAGEEALYTTDMHPFWVEGRGWTKAADLVVGAKLRSEGGEMLAVASNVRIDAATFFAGYAQPAPALALAAGITSASLDTPAFPAGDVVHNIEVDGTHNYFVGKAQVLVHNK